MVQWCVLIHFGLTMTHGHKTNLACFGMRHVDFCSLTDKCWNCPGICLGGKGFDGTKEEMSDRGKKGFEKQCQINGQTKEYVG